MGVLIALLAIAAVIGAVAWNHKNQSEAMDGHEFPVASPANAVMGAISAAYCGGARAALKGFISRVSVTPNGASSFRTSTKIGDVGLIEVCSAQRGSKVHAHTTELHIGGHPMAYSDRSTLWGLSSRLSHVIYRMLGISVNAARMKRFQRGVEKQVNRQLRRTATV
jgi:hypothetical protein